MQKIRDNIRSSEGDGIVLKKRKRSPLPSKFNRYAVYNQEIRGQQRSEGVQLEQKEKVQEQMTASIIAAQPEGPVQSENSQLGQLNIQSMHLETALMAVQSERMKLLETQLKDQIAAVQNRNESISKLNDALSQLNKVYVILPADAKADTKLNLSNEITQAIQNAGIAVPNTDISKAEFDAMNTKLKSMIDSNYKRS